MKSILSASSGSLGLLCLCLYAILGGIKDIVVGHQGAQYDVYMMVFVVFGVTTLFFQLLWRVKPQTTPGWHQLRYQSGAWADLLWLNVASMMAWLGTYQGLVLLEPALAVALWSGIAPILMSGGDWLLRGKRPNRIDLSLGAGTMLVSIAIVWLTLSGHTAKVYSDRNIAMLGIGVCLVAALGMALVGLFAKRLYDRGCSAVFIMGNRFYLLLLIALCLQHERGQLAHFICSEWAWLLPLTLFGVILSLYLLQEGTRLCQPITVGLIFALSPSATLLAQSFDPSIAWLPSSVAANLLLVGISAIGVGWHWRHQQL